MFTDIVDLDGPARTDRRRGLGRTPALARSRAPLGVREPPRRGGRPHRRRLLRRLRPGRRGDRMRGRHPAAARRAIGGSTGSRPGCGSGCTPPRRPARAAITPARACTSAARGRRGSRQGEILVSTDVLEQAGPIRFRRLGAARGHPQGRPGAGRGSRHRVAVGRRAVYLGPGARALVNASLGVTAP